MTPGFIHILYAAIASVTTRFEFTHPVEQEDLEEFRQALWLALPYAMPVRVENTPSGRVLVEVHDPEPPGECLYRREMIVIQ